jgi:hypothetical protein
MIWIEGGALFKIFASFLPMTFQDVISLQIGFHIAPVQKYVYPNNDHKREGRPLMELNKKMPQAYQGASSCLISFRQQPVYEARKA